MSINDQITARVTNAIIAKLEAGTIPWKKGWKGMEGQPKNFITGNPYKGINVIILSMMGYGSPYWMTFNQCNMKGGRIRKDQKSTMIIWCGYSFKYKGQSITESEWKELYKKESERPYLTKFYRMTYHQVFNIEQTTLPVPKVEEKHNDPIAAAESLVNYYKGALSIRHDDDRAFYSPMGDYINVPSLSLFDSPECYYSVLFHEMTHSTGHASRLNREGVVNPTFFGSHQYSKEELVAEMGACFLSSLAGIEQKTLDNSAAYIASWLKALKNNRDWLLKAATKAQQAADYIINYK